MPRTAVPSASRVGRRQRESCRNGSPWSSRLGPRFPESIERDRDEGVDAGLQLRLARARQTFAKHRQQLLLRATGDEHDEAEPECALVPRLQRHELTKDAGLRFGALLTA